MEVPLHWVNYPHPLRVGEIHVLPHFDIIGHVCEASCSCGPVMDGEKRFVHNAHDGRHNYERGLAKMH